MAKDKIKKMVEKTPKCNHSSQIKSFNGYKCTDCGKKLK